MSSASTVASGHVDDRPFARTIYTLVARKFTGDLVIEQRGRTYRVAWNEGAVVAAESGAVGDSVGRVAVETNLIDAGQMGDVLRILSQGGPRTELEVVAEVGELTADELDGLKRAVVGRRAMRVFALPGASFTLEQPSTLEPYAGQAFDGRWIIYNGLRLHYDEQRLVKELRACVADRGFQLRPEALPLLGVFGFGAGDKPFLAALRDNPATIAQLEARMVDPAQRTLAYAISYALAASSCLALSGGATVSRMIEAHPNGAPRRPAAAPPAPAKNEDDDEDAPAVITAAPPPRPDAEAEPKTKPTKPRPRPRSTSRPPRQPPAGASVREPEVTADPTAGASTRSAVPVDIQKLLDDRLALMEGDGDHFAMLGVKSSAKLADVQAAYFKLARKLHPDRLRSFGLTDRRYQSVFAVVNQAFAEIADPARRAAYEEKLARKAEGGPSEREAEQMALNILRAEELYKKGSLALRHSNFKAALAAFKEALELNPDEAEHHALYAWTRWCTADDKDSVSKEVKKLLRAAIRLSPNNPTGYFYRGQIAKQLGQTETAEDCFRKVLELEPDHREADNELRLLHKRSGKKGGLFDRIKGR